MKKTSRCTTPPHEPSVLLDAIALAGIARGLAGVGAPRRFARLAGARPRPRTTRLLFGVREIALGSGLLLARRKAPWLWLRVAGDAFDAAIHGVDAADPRVRSGRTFGALALVVAAGALDLWSVWRESEKSGPSTVDAGRSEA